MGQKNTTAGDILFIAGQAILLGILVSLIQINKQYDCHSKLSCATPEQVQGFTVFEDGSWRIEYRDSEKNKQPAQIMVGCYKGGLCND